MSTPATTVPTSGIRTLEPLVDGDVRLVGNAVVFNIEDRTRDRFSPDAFDDAVEPFMNGDPQLRFHHHKDGVIGQVEELFVTSDGKALGMVARLAYQEPDAPFRPIFEACLDGRVRWSSVGGYFGRRPYGDGTQLIEAVSLTEVSLTRRPAGFGTEFRIIERSAPPRVVPGRAVPSLEQRMADLEARRQVETWRKDLGLPA